MSDEPPGDGQAAGPQAEVAALRIELDTLRRREAELRHQLAALQASTSWRITAPLRSLATMLRWTRQAASPANWRRMAGALRHERQRRGWRGVLQRLTWYWSRRQQLAQALQLQATRIQDSVQPALQRPRLHPDLQAEPPAPLAGTVSVIIPTLNAGAEFPFLLRKLRQQRSIERLELIVVDSGSTDGTPERAAEAGAIVHRIPPAEFSHSATRNLGAERSNGEYLLFMVQDAYPIGEHWIRGLVQALHDHGGQGLAAVSCVEQCRSDSDLWVECAIATHSDFLGCRDADRVGRLAGTDHQALRSMGQLSDVACLIRRDLFLRHRYRGRYAEDLELGVRLIRDGHRIAMLSSLKVVHSHLRPSMYTLKRGFVDICVLRELFPDFPLAACDAPGAVVVAARHLAREVDAWIDEMSCHDETATAGQRAERWLRELQRKPIRGDLPAAPLRLDDARTAAFVAALADGLDRAAAVTPGAAAGAAARAVVDDFVARFDHFNRYVASLHAVEDDALRRQWAAAAAKALAATLGAMLAAVHLSRRGAAAGSAEARWIDRLAAELTSGV